MPIKYNLLIDESLELLIGKAECGMPESLLAATEKEMMNAAENG